MFGIVFSFNVKRTNIFACLHYIRLSYNTKKCFSALSIRMRTHSNVQSCPYNEKRGYDGQSQ